MRLPPWWWRQSKTDPTENRLARFRKVLEAAQNSRVYQASLRTANLDNRKALKRLRDIKSGLAGLGVFTIEQTRVRPRREMASPLKLTSPLLPGGSADLYWNSNGCALVQERAAGTSRHRALFIRIGLDEGLLSAMDREGLWYRHGVPMFEHLVGMDGELMAWECEAHRGLHVMEENAVFELVEGELLLTSLTDLLQPTIQTRTGWSAQIENEPCDCGRPGPRLTGLRELATANKLAAAAHA